MKRTLMAVFALFLLLAVTGAIAQEHMMRAEGSAAGMERHVARLAEILQLTPDQKAVFDSAHAEATATIQPLLEQSRAAHDQLRALLNSDNPDATAVGRQAILAHSIEKQIDAVHQAAFQKVEAVLTPDQKARFSAMHASEGGAMGMHMMVAPCGAMHE